VAVPDLSPGRKQTQLPDAVSIGQPGIVLAPGQHQIPQAAHNHQGADDSDQKKNDETLFPFLVRH